MQRKQKGVGMVEVLVSLLILAIAVMGFVALQVRAIQASQDALIKTQAIHFMQSISESIRVNPEAKAQYATSLNTYVLAATKPTASKKCDTQKCTVTEFATFDMYDTARQANEFGIRLGIATCPGIATSTPNNMKRLCILSAWGDTAFTGSASTLNYSSCMNSSGSYVSSSKCLLMETY